MNKKISLAIALLACITSFSHAQSFQEGFMLKDYRLIYHFNPALAGESDFISLFQVSSSNRNNVGASAFIYPYDGQVVTYLHSSVPAQTARENFRENNYLTKSYDFNLFSYGMFRNGAEHTFELNIRGMYAISAPGELFMFAKTGAAPSTLDLSRLRAQGDIYAELAYGYSRRVSDVFSFGARVKLLGGLYALDYNVTRLDLSMSESKYQADIEASLDLTDQAVGFAVDSDGYMDFKDFTYKGLIHIPKSYGAAVDLGIAVYPTENLTLSASVTDLGGIFWYFGNASRSSGTVSFTGLENLSSEEFNEEGLMTQANTLKDRFLEQIRLSEAETKARFKAIPFSANLGAKYSMPFYDRLSAGLTGQYIGYQWMPYWEGRFALACNPVDWFDCTANIGTGAYGMVWGAAGSICFHRFRLNVALTNGFGGYIPEKRNPLKPTYKNVTFGLTYDL